MAVILESLTSLFLASPFGTINFMTLFSIAIAFMLMSLYLLSLSCQVLI